MLKPSVGPKQGAGKTDLRQNTLKNRTCEANGPKQGGNTRISPDNQKKSLIMVLTMTQGNILHLVLHQIETK